MGRILTQPGQGEEYQYGDGRPVYDHEHDAKVIKWRADCFRRAGLDPLHAEALAVRRDVDRILVERMAAQGCPSHIISATLL